MTSLEGKVALVTGSSSGIGREMARALAEAGATIVLSSRGGARLDETLAEFRARGLDAHAVAIDVTDDASVEEARAWIEETLGRVDLLVCNAGVGDNVAGMRDLPTGARFYDVPTSAAQQIVDTNLMGFFRTARAFAPAMATRGSGRIVYVSTSNSTLTRPGQLPYGPTKAAGEAMAKIMAQELADAGVAVNIVCPGGFVDTPMAKPGIKDFFEEHGMPVLSPDVLNETIVFLASTEAQGITGEKFVGKDFATWLHSKHAC